jgi:hypothetical protein
LEDGSVFKVFQTIERVIREPIVDLGRAIDEMRDYLLNAQKKKEHCMAELRENWFFLEGAIRSAARDSRAPQGSLPFRIFAEYTARSTTQIGSDAVIAEARRLDLVSSEISR